jgi:hypothetical protein
MGRPINKKYLGGRNRGADGNFGAANTAGDADLAGTSVASVTTNTAGTYTSAATLQFPIPLLAADGGVRATGTALYSPVAGQITVGGTQTQAYSSTDVITQATTGATYTPTLTAYSGFSIGSVTTGGVVTLTGGTITAVKGTSVTFNAGLTGTTGITAGATYYLTASVSSSSTVTLASSYALAIAGTAISIAGGTPTGTVTLTIGTTYGSIASAVYASGLSTTVNTTGLATTASVSSGAGLTLTVAQWGLGGATITNAGSTYSPASTNTIGITAATAEASITTGTVTASTGGQFSLGTAQSAGTFWVGQILNVSGTLGGTGSWSSYAAGNFVVTATNGTSTFTLATVTAATGLPTTAQTTTAGTITGLTWKTAATLTVTTPDGLIPQGMKFVTTGTGGSSGLTAGTYFIIAVNSSTNKVSVASTYANFFTSTYVALTADAAITATTGVGSQHLVISTASGSGLLNAVLAAEVTTGYAGKYAAIVGMAIVGANGTLRQGADLIKQENTRRYKVETQDGIGYCTLVAQLPTVAGTVAINATDFNGSTYWVQKLNNRKVTIRRNTVNGSFQFADGVQVPWTFGAAVTNYSVKIDNI